MRLSSSRGFADGLTATFGFKRFTRFVTLIDRRWSYEYRAKTLQWTEMTTKALQALVLASIPLVAADEMTLYELLPPETHQFAITYDVTATKEGADFYMNPVRRGSAASKERVIERSSGKELKFELVEDGRFIRVHLPAPVPKNGETRIRIFKTYTDAASYYEKDGQLIFDRPFGIRRNVVVLPAGWELTGCASPGIVSTQSDGRIRVSFVNDRDDQLPVKITARRLP